jgi:serine/threonine protein kinase, bacterial
MVKRARRAIAALAGTALALAGCGSGGGGVANVVNTPAPAPSSASSPTGVYVADGTSNSVLFFAPNGGTASGVSLAGTIAGAATGLNVPDGIALDASARIYVANLGPPPSITVYAPAPAGVMNAAPIATIAGAATRLVRPLGVAVDSAGRIYVANNGGGNPSAVLVFAANPTGTLNEAPVATIQNASSNGSPPVPGLNDPQGIALDAGGRIYVADGGGFVAVFAANPTGVVTSPPIAVIAGSNTGLAQPRGVAVDASGNIYVSDLAAANANNNGAVMEFAPPSGTTNAAPIGEITIVDFANPMVLNAFGVAVDGAGQVYIASNGGNLTDRAGTTRDVPPMISVFGPGPIGYPDPLVARFAGSLTGLSGGDRVAVFSSGSRPALSIRRGRK